MRPLGQELERAAAILKAIAHPLRLRILSTLWRGEESVSGIAARLGAKPATVSQALVVLRREGLVAVTRHRAATYRLQEPSLRDLVPIIERTLAAPGSARAGREPRAGWPSRGELVPRKRPARESPAREPA